MIMDRLSEFADNVTLSTSTGRSNVGNAIDTTLAGIRDFGGGASAPPIFLVIAPTVALTSGGSATVEFQLVSDSTDPVADNGSATEHLSTVAQPIANFAVGTHYAFPLPAGRIHERYLGISMVVGSTALTGGAISAFLTLQPQAYRAYPEGLN